MPTVPRYQRQVSPTPLPAARLTAALTPGAAGVGVAEANVRAELEKGRAAAANWQGLAEVGQTVQRVAPVLANIVLQERERADQVAVMEAENELNAGTTRLLYDPQTGALTKKGKNAMGAPEEALAGFNQLADGADAKLTNARQKRVFSNIRSNRQAQLDLTVRRHTMQQIEVYENETLEANVRLGVNKAIAGWSDPATRAYELGNVVTNVTTTMARRGASEEAIQSQVQKITTATHAGIVEQYIANDQAEAGQAYFDQQVKNGEISGDVQAKIQEQLTRATERQKVDQKSVELFDQITSTLPQDQWLAQVKKEKDVKVRDALQTRLEHQIALNERQEREARDARSVKARQWIDAGGSYESLPASVRDNFDIAEAAGVKAYAKAEATQVATVTNPLVLRDLLVMAHSTDPAERWKFVTYNMTQQLGNLSKADWEELVKMQQTVRAGDLKQAQAMMTNETAQVKMVDQALLRMGMRPDPGKPGDKGYSADEVYRNQEFRRAVSEAAARQKNHKQAELTDLEMQQIVDALSTEVFAATTGIWNWPQNQRARYAYEVEQAAAVTVGGKPRPTDLDVNDIPPGERQLIINELRRAGAGARMPSNEEILAQFRTKLRGIRGDVGGEFPKLALPPLPKYMTEPPPE